MNKTQTVAAIAVTTVVAIAATRWLATIKELQDRFPDIENKIVRKAYLRFLKNAFQQNYGDIEDFNDEQMDALFLVEVQTLAYAK